MSVRRPAATVAGHFPERPEAAVGGTNRAPAAPADGSSSKRGVPTRSLKARAIHWLSLREHSRVELRRKLLPHASAELPASPAARSSVDGPQLTIHDDVAAGTRPRADEAGDREGPEVAPAGEPDASSPARVEALLDWLEANGYLSDERFVESRVQARAPRFGNLRIRRELKEHRLVLSAEAFQLLQTSELGRARALVARRFDAAPTDAGERARRVRFLSGRGFSFDVIVRVLNGRCGDDEPG